MNHTEAQIEFYRTQLREWGKKNVIDYPWRWINDPYKVLVAEFMLHRTQVKQVLPVYQLFVQKWPTLRAFIAGNSATIQHILASLGLNWRIKGMINALTELWHLYGTVPSDPEKLTSVEGIGHYIANATYCFSTNRPAVLVDTNTVRVIGRIFGLNLQGEARRRKSVIQMIDQVCDPHKPRDYYYSLIDFAHNICTPRAPACHECPLLHVPCDFGIRYITTGN